MTRSPAVQRIPLRQAVMLIGLTSVVVALLIVGALWVQMVNGNDPALGPKIAGAPRSQGSSSNAAPTPVVGEGQGLGEENEGGDDGLTVLAPAPQTAPPVAPSPAPAPVQTRTS